MNRLQHHWYRLPVHIRKPVVLVVGLAFVIAAPFTGVLPGPGGIPVFLIGVAILATEFEWAQRLRDWTLHWVHLAGQAWRRHKLLGTVLIIVAAGAVAATSYLAYRLLGTRFKA